MANSFAFLMKFKEDLNTSLQVGDNAYYNTLISKGGFSHNGPLSTVHAGVVTAINHESKSVALLSYNTDTTGAPCVENNYGCGTTAQPPSGSYISFSKSSVVNNNDLTGYYASVDFVNDSRGKAELFSVASNVTESSK